MRERPILFSGPMVRAILSGKKTQTRRVVRKQFAQDAEPAEVPATSPEGWQISGHSGLWWDDAGACIDDAIRCPYGQPGDRLWVREAFRFLDAFDEYSPSRVGELCLAAGYTRPWAPTQYEADGLRDNWVNVGTAPGSITAGKLRPGIHMPSWASRILLEITAVRVERLQDISEADAVAEGIHRQQTTGWFSSPGIKGAGTSARAGYALLWNSINGDDAWDANPWVWVIEFRRIDNA